MKNKYDEVYNYRLANVDDADTIMKFIREEWAENHILGNDKAFFMWQYGRKEYHDNFGLNFVLMTDKTGRLLGIIGFISYDENNQYISTTMAKVLPGALLPMSGVELVKRQMNIVGERENFASGTNNKTMLPLYERVFLHKTGIMQQYYILNPDVKKYVIARVGENEHCKDFRITEYSIMEFQNYNDISALYDFDEVNENMPVKSKEFIKKRYFEHPIYTYKKWIIRNERQRCVGILFGREIVQNGAKILRFVDYRGNLRHLSKIGLPLHNLMIENRYEYLDLMASNLSEYHMDEAGFTLLDPDGKTVIPNYFEPFVQSNIKNYYQTKNDIVIFKADGDQDRPSLLRTGSNGGN